MTMGVAHKSVQDSIQKSIHETMHKKRLNYLSLFMLVLVFCVVGLGAYTRLSDSGLGCPDWPGCYGFFSVPDQVHELALAKTLYPDQVVDYEKGAIEMLHRYVAGIALLGALAIFIITLIEKINFGVSRYFWHACAIFLVILLQAAFGMWTVTLKLWPQVVTAHLLGGFTTLSLVYLLWLRTRKKQPALAVFSPFLDIKSKHLFLAVCVFFIVVGQIFLGGWMAANYAAFACPDFPLCQGDFWPNSNFAQGFNLSQQVGPMYLGGLLDGEARVAIHLAHRIGALITVLAVSLLAFYIFNKDQKLAYRLYLLLFLQVSLGIANVWLQIPIGVAVLHNLTAALLMLTVIKALYLLTKLKGLNEKGLNYEL